MKPGRFVIMILIVCALLFGSVLTALGAERQTYTVKPGDTLWGLAQRFYGNQYLWPKLWEMNRDKLANPNRLSVGDVLVIFPLDLLMTAQAPPAPPPVNRSLYEAGRPLEIEFPKYFTYVSDPKGLGGSGATRIKVKKIDPLTGKTIITYDEVREVGEVIASMETGYIPEDITKISEDDIHGKLLLAYYDDVVVRFTEDVAKILDSATHEDPDPYFREFPIYGRGMMIREPDQNRHDFDAALGQLNEFKGKVTIFSRVETLAPLTKKQEELLAGKKGLNRDSEPVSYVGKITYSSKPISVGDRIFLFKSLYPGPDRQTDSRKLHQPGQYKDHGF
ncbi:MAG: LysM domain-containing protein [Thermodesulfobacteriota bacterium]